MKVEIYNFKIIPLDLANTLWNKTATGSVFNSPSFLNEVSNKVEWWLASKREEPICIWPVCLNESNEVFLPRHSFYVGPIWLIAQEKYPVYRWFHTNFEVLSGFINSFIENYKSIRADLPSSFHDIRAINNYNLNNPNNRIQIDIRYTAVIKNLQNSNMENWISEMNYDRRSKVKKLLIKNDYYARDIIEFDTACQMHEQFVLGKGLNNPEFELSHFQKVINIAKEKNGFILALIDRNSHSMVAFSVVLYSKDVANLVYLISTKECQDLGVVPLLVLESLRYSKNICLNAFDFNGANTYNLAHDKHTFGALPELFFRITYN